MSLPSCFSRSASIAAFAVAVLLLPASATPAPAAASHSGGVQHLTSPDQVPDGLTPSAWSSIRAAYEAGRHAIVTSADGHTARNPAQQWQTTFDARGFLNRPATGGWEWGLALASYGFPSERHAVTGSPTVVTKGARITYAWDAVVSEWFVNEPRGLEHGFTVHERPSRANADAEGLLVFDLAVRGSLRGEAQPDGQGVRFLDAAGNAVVNYVGLKVADADGRILSARLCVADARVRLSVDERGARYPLTIDPVAQMAQQAYLKASNTDSNDEFGWSVAIAGDTVVIGAIRESSNATGVGGNQADNSASNSGAAYVFTRSGATWTQQAYLKASNTDSGDQFGYSVAIAGDTVVVGAVGEASNATGVGGNQADNSASYAGAAYVFTRSGATWTQQAYLKASNTDSGDEFGNSVAIAGDTVVIGASTESSNATGVGGNQADNSASNSGAAYVFTRSGATWTQQAYLKASNTDSGDEFGYSVAIAGDTVVIGAIAESSNAIGVGGNQADNSATYSGAAYVFTRSGATWTQQAYLKASNTDSGDYFGYSVAIAGDTVVVGAVGEASNATGVGGNQADNSASFAGAAYVFTRSGATWTQQAYLKASNTDSGDEFGWSVAIAGDTVVIGAAGDASNATGVGGNQADNSASNSGAAYVFTRSGATWTQQAYLKASNTDSGDYFGYSVAIAGDTVVVGAIGEASKATGVGGDETDNSAGSSGAVYVFATPASEGAVDDGFLAAPLTGPNGVVNAVAVQPDGKILIAGGFINVNGTDRGRIARLNADGTLDASFGDNLSGASDTINAMALLPDGKILITGAFRAVNDSDISFLARLNSDGSLDTDFRPESMDSVLFAMAVQPDGKILLSVGAYGQRHGLVRLNADGALDSSFLASPLTGTGPNGFYFVRSIVVQPDGKILIGGEFQTVNGTERNHIARLNRDGSLDTNFMNGLSGANARVYGIALQRDGKILISGDFNLVNDTSTSALARLNSDGSLDPDFAPSRVSGDRSKVISVFVQQDGKILIGGPFSQFAGIDRGCLARLNADGTLDPDFLAAPLTGTTSNGSEGGVVALAVQDDGKIMIGGDFTTFNDEPHVGVARLTSAAPTPEVVSIVRDGASSSSAATVAFTVTFSNLVTGVDANDFTLTTTGNLAGASVTHVSGSGTTYMVTANAGTGTGTLRLDLTDNDSIVSEAASIPLGGAGADNGSFTTGESVTIVAPYIRSITRSVPFAPILPDATTRVTYHVRFSEPVTDVDGDDFELLTTGDMSATIDSISASEGTDFDILVSEISGHGALKLASKANATIEDERGNAITTTAYIGGQTYTRLFVSTPIAWGDNNSSQFGDGTTNSSNVPTAAFTTGALAGKIVIAVTSGERHTVALTADGKVFTWGSNQHGELGDDTVDESSSTPLQVGGALASKTIVAISAGDDHTLALASDGSVFAWGNNSFGQIGDASQTQRNTPYAVDPDLFGGSEAVVAIGAGGNHSFALTASGHLYAWGYNAFGQLGDGTTADSSSPVEASLENLDHGEHVISMVAGDAFSSLLTDAGRILTCGRNDYSELGQGTTGDSVTTFAPIVAPDGFAGAFVAVACGQNFSLALAEDGQIYAWGLTGSGEFGNGTSGYSQSSVPLPVDQSGVLAAKTVITVSTGARHSLALTDDGRVFAWGYNGSGMLGDGTNTDSAVPVAVKSDGLLSGQHVVALASGPETFSSLALIDAELPHITRAPSAGSYGNGQILTFAVTFPQMATVTGSPRIALNFDDEQHHFAHYVSTSEDGLTVTFAYTIGAEDSAPDGLQLGTSIDLNGGTIRYAGVDVETFYSAPGLGAIIIDGTAPEIGSIVRPLGVTAVTGLETVAFEVFFSETVTSNGGDLGADDFVLTATSGNVRGNISDVQLVSSNNDKRKVKSRLIAFAKSKNQPAAYRATITGLTGHGTFRLDLKANRPIADEAGNSLAPTGFTGGQTYTRFEGGAAFAWGNNDSGQLGNNDDTNVAAPVAVGSTGVLAGKSIAALANGAHHTLALTSDGKIYSWGSNSDGQLGRPGDDSSTPVAVDATGALAGKTVVAIAAGEAFSVALTSDGNVVTWGNNESGQLGVGKSHSSDTPVLVAFDDGDDDDKKDNLNARLLPVPVSTHIVAIAAGAWHVLALAEDGVLYAWGDNSSGQLGDNSRNDSSFLSARGSDFSDTPVEVDRDDSDLGESPIVAIAAGVDHSLALTEDGGIFAWGANDAGQLGDGSTDNASQPVEVDASEALDGKTIVAIGAGGGFSLALDSNGQAYAWGANDSGQLGIGDDSMKTFDPEMKSSRSLKIRANPTTHLSPTALHNPVAFVSLAIGEGHVLALGGDGKVYAWGDNQNGQLGRTGDSVNAPLLVDTSGLSSSFALGLGPTANHSSLTGVAGAPPSDDGGSGGSPEPIAATVTLSDLTTTYDGTAKHVTAVTSPANLNVFFTYDGSTVAPSAIGHYAVVATITSAGYEGSAKGTFVINAPSPLITQQPVGVAVTQAAGATFSVTATSLSPLTYQWRRNGADLAGATGASLTLSDIHPDNVGYYSVVVSGGGSSTLSDSALLELNFPTRVTGGDEVGTDIHHPNGNIYDQILLTTDSASTKADPEQVVRMSFIDLNDDIVQVEFFGAGTLTVSLADSSGPAAPVKYNQPDVAYMKGHATIEITGANKTSHLSVFSVGRITAVDQTLFRDGVSYDGVADIALVTIESTDGKFGGVRTGNAHYFNASGMTGIYAPGVDLAALYIGDLSAGDTAVPVLLTGTVDDARISGGSLEQLNGAKVEVGDLAHLQFTDGATSGGLALPAQTNKAKFVRDGVDVTDQVVK